MNEEKIDINNFDISAIQRKADVKKIRKYAKIYGIPEEALPLDFSDDLECLQFSRHVLVMYNKLLSLCERNQPTKEELIEYIIPRTTFLRTIALLAIKTTFGYQEAKDIIDIESNTTEIWLYYLKLEGLSEEECGALNIPITFNHDDAFKELTALFQKEKRDEK